jgi:hypothetical protein
LAVSALWHNGPEWLRYVDGVDDVKLELDHECLAEMRVQDRKSVYVLLITSDTPGLSEVVRCERFSSLDRLFSVTAIVVKLCNNLLGQAVHLVIS